MRWLVILLCIITLLTGCSTVSYYGQAATGQLGLMLSRKDIDKLLLNPKVEPQLKQRLTGVQQARQFAIETLDLPDSGSYRSYVDLNRDYVVWNVVSTPEFSVQPRSWCFPIAGCVLYKGFFSQKMAAHEANRLKSAGNDTVVVGAVAYSTLGYLKDPVLSTMMSYSDRTLSGVIFHEMAHQRVYVPGDSAFNEAYATAVERAGLALWEKRNAVPEDLDGTTRDQAVQAFNQQVKNRLLGARRDLANLYTCELAPELMRSAKAKRLATLQDQYRKLQEQHPQMTHWDDYFSKPLNNADLALVATYEEHVAPILAELEALDGDWAAFHQRMQELAELDQAERHRWLGVEDNPPEPQADCNASMALLD